MYHQTQYLEQDNTKTVKPHFSQLSCRIGAYITTIGSISHGPVFYTKLPKTHFLKRLQF